MSYSGLIFLILCAVIAWSFITWRLFKWASKNDWDRLGPLLIAAMHLVLAWVFWGWLLIDMPTGLAGVDKNYAHGDVEGYLYAVEHRGVIWKTYEIAILVGETEADSLEWRLSTPSKRIGETLMGLRGKKIKIEYRQWYRAPWKVGATDVEITHVEANERKVEQEE